MQAHLAQIAIVSRKALLKEKLTFKIESKTKAQYEDYFPYLGHWPEFIHLCILITLDQCPEEHCSGDNNRCTANEDFS